MNTRDEIIDALEGRRGEYAPPAIFTQTGTISQMECCGSSWPDANFNVDKMVDLALQPSKRFGFATAKVPFCITVETEAAGGSIDRGSHDRQPAVTGSKYRVEGMIPDVPDLPSPSEFVGSGRCPLVREAASRIRNGHEDLFVIGGVVDPFTVAYQLVGVDDFLMGLLMDPDGAKKWVDALTPLLVEQAKCMSETADDVQIIAEASSEILPPECLGDMVLEPVKRMIQSIGCFSTVHSCGETSDVLADLASMGEDGLSVETVNGPTQVLETIAGKTNLLGGIPAVSMLMQGTPEIIRKKARECSDLGFSIITPECGVPPLTSNENLLALSHYRD